jgi:hypothetical protein
MEKQQLITKTKTTKGDVYRYIGNGIVPIYIPNKYIQNMDGKTIEEILSNEGNRYLQEYIDYRKENPVETKMEEYDRTFGFDEPDPNIDNKQIQIEILRQLALSNFLKAYELKILDQIRLL